MFERANLFMIALSISSFLLLEYCHGFSTGGQDVTADDVLKSISTVNDVVRNANDAVTNIRTIRDHFKKKNTRSKRFSIGGQDVVGDYLSKFTGNIDTMQKQKGDLIKCKMSGGFAHYMLVAEPESTVVHIVADGATKDDSNSAHIRHQHIWSLTEFDHNKCKNFGQGKYGAEAVDRAAVGEKVRYNFYTCNCIAYVMKWYSDTSSGSDDCDV